MSQESKNEGCLGCLTILLVLGYAFSQLCAGYLGIEHHFGKGWAIAGVILALMRLSIPISIGSFFGAMNVWGWHWSLALAFAAPGLAFFVLMFIPSFFAALLSPFTKK